MPPLVVAAASTVPGVRRRRRGQRFRRVGEVDRLLAPSGRVRGGLVLFCYGIVVVLLPGRGPFVARSSSSSSSSYADGRQMATRLARSVLARFGRPRLLVRPPAARALLLLRRGAHLAANTSLDRRPCRPRRRCLGVVVLVVVRLQRRRGLVLEAQAVGEPGVEDLGLVV